MSRELERNNSRSSRDHEFIIKLRGLPFSTKKEDIRKFLFPCHVVTVHLFDISDNSLGECLVDLESENDVKNALKNTNQYIGNRYIEVSRATNHEFNFFIKHKGMTSWRDPVIRVNGLPFTCTMADVQIFFKDIEIARNGIYITRDMSDNALGGGYVAFVSMDNAYKAIDLYDQKHIQHRYIELNPSTYDDAKKTIASDAQLNGKRFAGENDGENKNNYGRNQRKSRSNSQDIDDRYRPLKRHRSPSASPRSRPRRLRDNYRRRSRSRSPIERTSQSTTQNGEYLIKMRGMPFTVIEKDIREFFPSTCQPVRIEIIQDRRVSRPNGDGYVYFSSMDAITEAMKCDRKYMGNRYVELYFDSPRHSSPTQRRSKSNESPARSSRSRSKTKTNEKSRSRSESQH